MKDCHNREMFKTENPSRDEVIAHGRKGHHVRLWERLDRTDEIIFRKGKLGYTEGKGECFLTTSVSCVTIDPSNVVAMYAPRLILARRRRNK